MIFITGDTHGGIDFDKLMRFKTFAEGQTLTKDDYVIVTGDFGGTWDLKEVEKTRRRMKNLPFTLLFVDGNHENFDLLDAYPVSTWHGGKIHQIFEDVIHLMRGQVFSIENKTFFTFGGAESTDRAYRREGTSWWARESPSEEEFQEAWKNLSEHNYKVDFIVTHALDHSTLKKIFPSCEKHLTEERLNELDQKTTYQKWYCGHYHVDQEIDSRKVMIYKEIREIY